MNYLMIGKDRFEVSSLLDAQDVWFAALMTYQWPSSEAPRCHAVFEGQRYKVSYNGRVWDSQGNEVKLFKALA